MKSSDESIPTSIVLHPVPRDLLQWVRGCLPQHQRLFVAAWALCGTHATCAEFGDAIRLARDIYERSGSVVVDQSGKHLIPALLVREGKLTVASIVDEVRRLVS